MTVQGREAECRESLVIPKDKGGEKVETIDCNDDNNKSNHRYGPSDPIVDFVEKEE